MLDDTNGDEIPDGVSDVIIAGRSVNNSGVETLTRNNGQSFSAQVQLQEVKPPMLLRILLL